MTLKPLLPGQFDCLKPLLAERLKECKLAKLSSPEHILQKLVDLYAIHSAGAYVDDVTDPKHCLIMTHFPGVLVPGVVAQVNLIYTRVAHRGNPSDVDTLCQTAENYARLNGASSVVVSSWVYEGSKGTDALWIKRGYKERERIFVQHLT